MKPSDFDYELPPGRIAQRPAEQRDASRLLLLDRATGEWQDRCFAELPELLRGEELLVVNNTRVLPARLFGRRRGVKAEPAGRHSAASGEHLTAQIEVLLTRALGGDTWQALVRPGRKIRVGERIVFGKDELEAEVTGRGDYGLRELRFSAAGSVGEAIERLGHMPLPPYIDRPDEAGDRERYQTVFARETGAVAAPTAGLHFTPEVLGRLRAHGAATCEITLHVGLGTFQPIHAENLDEHRMHAEPYEISESAAGQINAAHAAGRPILAVGTTVVRALEAAALRQEQSGSGGGVVAAGAAEADLFLRPGHRFRVVRQMLTNFHLPKSSLLVLVAAFAGREHILRAYAHATEDGYRFYSYGDCMLIR
jgi:S-adenosylmethionine:tRNA ribosyltransferase-isomerase